MVCRWDSTTLRVKFVIMTTLASGLSIFVALSTSMSASCAGRGERGEPDRPLVDIRTVSMGLHVQEVCVTRSWDQVTGDTLPLPAQSPTMIIF